MSTADSNWLAALQTCIADGGTLAKPETAAENTEIQTLLGEEEYNYLLGNKIWIDFFECTWSRVYIYFGQFLLKQNLPYTQALITDKLTN